MTKATEAVRRFFRIAYNRAGEETLLPAIFPGHMAPVVRRVDGADRELVMLSWGFVLLRRDKARSA